MCVGEKDITITPGTVRAAYKKQKKSPSVTEFKIFSGQSHFLFHEPGWEEVADHALDWASRYARADVRSNAIDFEPRASVVAASS